MHHRLVIVTLCCLFPAAGKAPDPVTIFMIGDSTMADKPLEGNPERGWGQMFPAFFDSSVRVENHARNGRSTRSFLREGLWTPVRDRIRAGDVVIIQFGHNDQSREKVDRYTPPEEYRNNLIMFVKDTREREGRPVLCTPVMRRRFDEEGKFYDVHGVYPDIVREVARELNVPLIDLHRKTEALIVASGPEESKNMFLWVAPGMFTALPGGKEDNTHFSEYGATVVAGLAAAAIRELHPDLAVRLIAMKNGEGMAGERADIIVDAGGRGHFVTIQEALGSIPADERNPVMIFIRNGLYHEKLFITRSRVTLVGEDQQATRIVFAELRENWNAAHNGSDWGSGVVNIDTGVTDIVLANLTVRNNYGSLHGTDAHQFAIRGMGTRITLLHCNVISDGGDALSLWNKDDGMYYHNGCFFEGGVDYVCPRGWCYITESRFFGHNLSASIWHDGDRDPDQKFVITHSFFDGVEGFPLGRNHRDGQFFLAHCRFSSNMADRPIYHPPGSRTEWQWGPRHYYYNCHRDGGNFSWFANNLPATASGSPGTPDFSAAWTFGGRWDPEGTMTPVLPFAFLPSPANNSTVAGVENVSLTWVAGRNSVRQRVSFGTSNPPPPVSESDRSRFVPGELEPGRTYFWRVDTITGSGTIDGPVWQFTTQTAVRQ